MALTYEFQNSIGILPSFKIVFLKLVIIFWGARHGYRILRNFFLFFRFYSVLNFFLIFFYSLFFFDTVFQLQAKLHVIAEHVDPMAGVAFAMYEIIRDFLEAIASIPHAGRLVLLGGNYMHTL